MGSESTVTNAERLPGLMDAGLAGLNKPTRDTFFLDEVGDMTLATQVKLLRVFHLSDTSHFG